MIGFGLQQYGRETATAEANREESDSGYWRNGAGKRSRQELMKDRPQVVADHPAAGYIGRFRNPAAMLDVDGTLLANPTPLGVSFAEYLDENMRAYRGGDAFDSAAMQRIKELMTDDDLTYVERVEGVIDAYQDGIEGCRHSTVSRLAREFMDEIGDTLSGKAEKAVETLCAEGYEVALVSLNPSTVLEEFRNVIGPGIIDEDDVYGLDFEIEDGVYTGKIVDNQPGFMRKRMAVEEILSSKHTEREHSTAAGDTRYDLPLLNSVDYPAMISPSPELQVALRTQAGDIPAYDDISEYVEYIADQDLSARVPAMNSR